MKKIRLKRKKKVMLSQDSSTLFKKLDPIIACKNGFHHKTLAQMAHVVDDIQCPLRLFEETLSIHFWEKLNLKYGSNYWICHPF